ncbi:GDAP2-like protein [Mya arenaria]|uniref:GDAP2-like protein n=1 Tax=Mya arenaria TaxID=6604 RepID=A0ABY7ED44_MYAAR|nr:GDAP2-like protein [Mya arenaria]
MMEEEGSQDPLGARDHVVYVDNMTRWNFTVLPLASDEDSQNHSESEEKVSPFPWRNDLNNKIILWSGDITELSVHAIVHSTNERMTERSSVTETLYTKAGPKLEAEIKNNIKVCKTGDAKISEGFDLLSRYVIHTVGPRYNVKYNVYEEVLPLYFPRNPQEERESLAHLPEDIGDDMGEPVIPERQIRIMDKPIYPKSDDRDFDDKTVDLNAEFGKSINGTVGQHPFASMQADPDTQKRLNPRSDVDMKKVEARKRYERLLKRARTEDLTDIASLRCLYRTGQDRFGRPVIVFVGRNFPASTVDLEKALLYAIRLLDPIVEQDYVVVYFHTHTSGQNLPPMNFLKNVYHILDHKYKKNLKSFYVVHPTWWSKFATWFFTTFTASDIKQKVHSLKGEWSQVLCSVRGRDCGGIVMNGASKLCENSDFM